MDKNELLAQGKHFGRVFLDYLCRHDDFQNGRGGLKQGLADELLVIGQAEGLTEKESLTINNVRHWRDGSHKIPFWVNRAALVLASEKGFVIEHPADAVAVVATTLVQYTDKKQIDMNGLLVFIEQRHKIVIPEPYQEWVRMFLQSRGYTVT